MQKALLTVMAALALPLPAAATTVIPKKYTCPVAGEVFDSIVLGSYSVSGYRPDGRPYGTLRWAPPMPECPGNGFLIFRNDLTAEEIAVLTPLVESAEYQALRRDETQHYRVWWLMRALPGSDPAKLASALLMASWHSDDDPARKARYQRAFIAAADVIPTGDAIGFTYALRAVNALRELGDFDAAATRLDALRAAPGDWPGDRKQRQWAEEFVPALAALISERNDVAEPTSLTPAFEAADRCMAGEATLSPSEQDACTSPAVAKAIAEKRAWKQSDTARQTAADVARPAPEPAR